MAFCLTDLQKELLKSAEYVIGQLYSRLFQIICKIFVRSDFEALAIGVWNTFDHNTDDLINDVILLRVVPYYNIDLLEMAVEGDSKKFVSHPSIQDLLTNIWHGNLVLKPKPTAKLTVSH